MELTPEIIISFCSGLLISSFIFILYLKKIASERGAFTKEKDLFFETNKLKSEKYFQLGREAGIKEERNKLQVRIIPYFEKEDGFFSSTLFVGYFEEVIYNGFSIGEPSYRSLKIYEKFKQENFDKITSITFDTIEKNSYQLYI
ncbi:hypothetical protein [Algoriphagus boritolerans]|uniref:hypothetical protein n=1 Tax=Algoriphagus boritolerans TaxID=308111 RepID=UPI000A9B9DBA